MLLFDAETALIYGICIAFLTQSQMEDLSDCLSTTSSLTERFRFVDGSPAAYSTPFASRVGAGALACSTPLSETIAVSDVHGTARHASVCLKSAYMTL